MPNPKDFVIVLGAGLAVVLAAGFLASGCDDSQRFRDKCSVKGGHVVQEPITVFDPAQPNKPYPSTRMTCLDAAGNPIGVS